jgi:hypothetical protein
MCKLVSRLFALPWSDVTSNWSLPSYSAFAIKLSMGGDEYQRLYHCGECNCGRRGDGTHDSYKWKRLRWDAGFCLRCHAAYPTILMACTTPWDCQAHLCFVVVEGRRILKYEGQNACADVLEPVQD